MANIEIDIARIDRALSNTSNHISEKCTRAYNNVNDLKMELPLSIKEKNNINRDLLNLRSDCNTLERNFGILERKIIKVLNRYVRNETGLTKDARRIKPKEVKVRAKIKKGTQGERIKTVKIDQEAILNINKQIKTDYIADILFDENTHIKVSNYNSGVCSATMKDCESCIKDQIMVDETYYFKNLNTTSAQNSQEFVNNLTINNNKKEHTRTIEQILGVSHKACYIDSAYLMEYVKEINTKVPHQDVTSTVNKNFSTDVKEAKGYDKTETLENFEDLTVGKVEAQSHMEKRGINLSDEKIDVGEIKGQVQMKQNVTVKYETLEDPATKEIESLK